MYGEAEEMSNALSRIHQAGESTFQDVFAGVEVIPEKGYAIVYRVPSPEFDAFIREAAGAQCVLVRDAAFANARLRTLQDRITRDTAFWRQRGITINTTGTNHDGSGVVVGTLDVAKARAELPKHYGTEIPIIITEEAAPILFAEG